MSAIPTLYGSQFGLGGLGFGQSFGAQAYGGLYGGLGAQTYGGLYGGLGAQTFGGLGTQGLYGAAQPYNAAQEVGNFGGFSPFSPYGSQFNLGFTGFGAWGGFGAGTYKNNCLNTDNANAGPFGFWGPRLRAQPCLDSSDPAFEAQVNPVFGYSNPFGGWAMGYAEPGYGGWGVWGSGNAEQNPSVGYLFTAPVENRDAFNAYFPAEYGQGWNLNYGYNPYAGLRSEAGVSYGPGPYFNGNYLGANQLIAARGLDSFGQLNDFYGSNYYGGALGGLYGGALGGLYGGALGGLYGGSLGGLYGGSLGGLYGSAGLYGR